MYAVDFQLVLCSGRQKILVRCSMRTMEKEETENEFPERNTKKNPLLILFCIFPSLSSYIFPLLVWYVCQICIRKCAASSEFLFCQWNLFILFSHFCCCHGWSSLLVALNCNKSLSMGDTNNTNNLKTTSKTIPHKAVYLVLRVFEWPTPEGIRDSEIPILTDSLILRVCPPHPALKIVNLSDK